MKLIIKEDKDASGDPSFMGKAYKLKKSLIPKDDTFNVVGIDEYELPHEALYLAGNFDTEKEANTKKKEMGAKGIKAHVYDKNTK